MLALLQAYLTTPAAARTAHQQSLYNWMQSLIQTNKIALYKNGVDQYNSWVNDACQFTLDPTIASQYGLSYDGTPWCGASYALGALFNPNLGVPAPSYFTTYGLEKSYGAVSSGDSNYGVLLSETGLSYGTVFAIAGMASGLISAAIAGESLAAGIIPVITVTADAGIAVGNALQDFIVTPLLTAEEFIPAAMAAVPVAIITMAIGISVGIEAFDYANTLSQLNSVDTTLTSLLTTPPDLGAMASDQSGQGWYKIQNTLLTRTMTGVCQGNYSDPNQPVSVPCAGSTPSGVPSTALPAHRVGIDYAFATPGNSATQESFSYRDWNDAHWTVQTWGGWLVQTCSPGTSTKNPDGSTSTGTCVQPDSITADFYYTDWSVPADPSIASDRDHWVASRYGNVFTLTKGITDSSRAPCNPDPSLGISTLPAAGNFDACSSYVTTVVNLIGGNGSHVSMKLCPTRRRSSRAPPTSPSPRARALREPSRRPAPPSPP